MRKIKFRGKRIDNGEWKYGDLLHIVGGCVIYHGSQKESELIEDRPNLAIELYMDEVSPVTPDTVGQFTGVKDDNGIEIFDNDIILINNSGVAIVTYVDFILSYIAVFIDKDKDNIMLCDLLDDEYVVIGNIYDNPELLKTE